MKTFVSTLLTMFLLLFIGCSSSPETVSENVNAESSDLTPPDAEVLQADPVIVHKEEPYFPEMAQKSGSEGDVVLRAWITKTGVVRKVQIHRADSDLFNASALAAGLKYTFEPMMKEGNAVDSWVEFTIRYRLNK